MSAVVHATPETERFATEQFLYLVEIIDVGVKVGISATPAQRVAHHRRDAIAYSRTVGRVWVSPVPHMNARANESAIKGDSKREYLDRSFDECLAQAESLPMHRAPKGDVREAPLNRFLSELLPAFGAWLDKEAEADR